VRYGNARRACRGTKAERDYKGGALISSELYKIGGMGRDEEDEEIFSERRINFMGCIF